MAASHDAADLLSRLLHTLLVSISVLLSTLLGSSQAQITLDGSLGPRGSLRGPHYTIPDTVGQIRGSNLFHSFGHFNLSQGESATFTGSNTIANILSRVTGGSPSSIDGAIRSQIPGAHLYLLNPSGVMFGPNATLDIRGAFHVSTADYLRLADGVRFSAHLSDTSVLTVAPPAAFGFLTQTPASISIQESLLEVPEGRSLSLIGGDVRIVGGPIGLLRARSGRIGVVSVASPGEVTFDSATQTPDLALGSFARLGSIDLSNQALLNTSGTPSGAGGGGTIVIRGGRLMMTDASELRALTLGDADGAPIGIDVRIAGEVVIDNSVIQTLGVAAGRAGDIAVSAGTLTVQTGGELGTNTFGAGPGGNLTLDVGRLTVTGGGALGTNTAMGSSGAGGALTIRAYDAVVVSGRGTGGASRIISSTDGTGPGGSVIVSASEMSLDGGSLLARTRAAGSAGNVQIEVDRLTLTGEGVLSGFSAGAGRAGSVTINAREAVSLAQGSLMSSATDASASGTPGRVLVTTPALRIDDAILGSVSLSDATTGDIEVRARSVSLTAGGRIDAGTMGTGGGGTISIVGVDPRQPAAVVSLSGRGRIGSSGISSQTGGRGNAGRVSIAARSLQVDGGTIVSNTFGAGQGGDIELHVGAMTLTGGAFLSSSVGEEATGRGGSVTVTASDSISVTADSLVGAFSFGHSDAGRVSITASSLSVEGGAAIATFASGGGRAGNITVDAGRVSVRGATLSSETRSAGRGGDVELRAQSLELSSGARISAASSSTGNAGLITLVTDAVLMREHSTVTTSATQADGGNIAVTAQTLVRLQDSQITTAVSSGQGRGGNITIDPQFVILDNSQITANAFGGPGGNITITAAVFLAAPTSQVSASSALGINGQVAIQAPVTSLSGAVAPLPQTFAQTAELLRSRCAERLREGAVSRLVLGGRDGVPLEPGSLLLSPLQRVDQETGVQAGPQQPLNPEPQHAWISSAQAHVREGEEGECARWMGQPGHPRAGVPKRRK
jgi:filamentous hemagglutinin family protein